MQPATERQELGKLAADYAVAIGESLGRLAPCSHPMVGLYWVHTYRQQEKGQAGFMHGRVHSVMGSVVMLEKYMAGRPTGTIKAVDGDSLADTDDSLWMFYREIEDVLDLLARLRDALRALDQPVDEAAWDTLAAERMRLDV